MKLINYTTYCTGKIRGIIREVCPTGVANFTIKIKNSQHFSGMAYTGGCSWSSVRGPLVTIKTPPYSIYKKPHVWKAYRAGYLNHVQYSWEEDLVHVIAHELRHLWQKKVKSGYRVCGARGKYSERDADAYAIQQVRRWRRATSPTHACALSIPRGIYGLHHGT